jgi:carboxymethylenebutenolidase
VQPSDGGLSALLVGVVSKQEARMEKLTSAYDGFTLGAHREAARGPCKGGVVVIQEIFGVTDHIREICAYFAEAGYEALAPSLYDRIEAGFHAGYDAAGIEKGRNAVLASPREQVAADVQAAIDALSAPVFVVGFCYGGAIAWLAAQKCNGLAAASGFYGRLITTMLDAPPRVPIILHYGRKDAGIPLAEVEKVSSAFPDIPIHLYDAGHGFCRAKSADYDSASCERALGRTLALFDAHLS